MGREDGSKKKKKKGSSLKKDGASPPAGWMWAHVPILFFSGRGKKQTLSRKGGQKAGWEDETSKVRTCQSKLSLFFQLQMGP